MNSLNINLLCTIWLGFLQTRMALGRKVQFRRRPVPWYEFAQKRNFRHNRNDIMPDFMTKFDRLVRYNLLRASDRPVNRVLASAMDALSHILFKLLLLLGHAVSGRDQQVPNDAKRHVRRRFERCMAM